jgi:hypothetical protein
MSPRDPDFPQVLQVNAVKPFIVSISSTLTHLHFGVLKTFDYHGHALAASGPSRKPLLVTLPLASTHLFPKVPQNNPWNPCMVRRASAVVSKYPNVWRMLPIHPLVSNRDEQASPFSYLNKHLGYCRDVGFALLGSPKWRYGKQMWRRPAVCTKTPH